jgi:cytoskeletal protein RodZ
MSTTAVHLGTELPFPGLSLASIRERIGITLEEIAQATRIASHYLRAIEAEEFTELPGGVYATSYIRQYSRAIGYSETALLDEYHARTEEAPMPAVAGQEGPRVTTRFGEALGEALELFRPRVPAKPRTQHSA